MDYSRLTIFAGNFGSGKTEISINYALRLIEEFSPVMLADLDVVNSYFRSREKVDFLEEQGIEVIFPRQLAKADLPLLTADIYKIIQNQDVHGVFDIGGNEEGAIALGSLADQVKKEDYEFNLVINTRRPQTGTVKGIIKMKESIESACKLKFNNIIANINLGKNTVLDLIKEEYPLIEKVSDKLDLPVKFLAIKREILPLPSDYNLEVEVFPLDLYMNPPWER